jgi:glycosyltransferase involved in cell wall biosynthesis
VHDWFAGVYGSERVVDVMVRDTFASAGARPDVFTFHAAHEVLPRELSEAIVQESAIARLPMFRQRGRDPGRWRWLLPLMPRFFAGLKLDAYELVVSSSHSCAVNARSAEGAVHLCYCHTPMRYAWMTTVEGSRVTGVGGLALRAMRRRLRAVDLAASARVDHYIANSTAVQDRIRRFYGRDSVVIHPPVDVADFDPSVPKERDHFLWVHRLVPYKRPEEVMDAFRDLPYRLTMVGVGPLEPRLRARCPPNVEVLGWLDRARLAGLFERSGGFIHVGEEDFGITMVEALAAGTPVIALGRGGATDIVRDGVDGIILRDLEPPSLRRAIQRLASTDWDPEALARRAQSFSRDRFSRELRAYAEHALER